MDNNVNISNRAALLKTTTEKNLSRHCLVLISNIIRNAPNKEEMAYDINEIVSKSRVEQDIVDKLQFRYC